ncbi:MAG TPA: neutral/alkaline non-lysosomal ceramidase N-terminal domain-containing protein [Tepidisphaeraceae bacterium]|jgi:hypothetical protein
MSMLRATSTKLEIQPVPGAFMAGFAARSGGSTGTLDPLFARLFLLNDEARTFLWVTLELLGLSTHSDKALREQLSKDLSIPASHIWISCSHTHSGPFSMPLRGPVEMDTDWVAQLFRRIASAASKLKSELQPVSIKSAVTSVHGLGYNRQDESCPIDERLNVVALEAASGKTMATLVNYALHPVVLGEQSTVYSADYAGRLAAAIEKRMGGECLFILGAAGDVDPVIYRDQGRHAGTAESIQQIGSKLADAAISALSSAKLYPDACLMVAEKTIEVPLDPPPSQKELAAIKAELCQCRGDEGSIPPTDQGKWAIFELAWVAELEKALEKNGVPKIVPARLSALRVGNLYAVAVPFEMYSQIGLDMRSQLEPVEVMVAGYTNGLIGYAPTARAKQQGGYGPACSHRFFPELLTALSADAEKILVRETVNLVRSLM